MARSQKSPSAGKEKILNAAEKLFAVSGYHGASLRDITRAAGVEVGLSSYHFRSKDDLYQQVLSRRAPEMAAALAAALAVTSQRQGGKDALRAILHAYVQTHLERLHSEDAGWRDYLRLAAEAGLLLHRSDLSESAVQHYAPVLAQFRNALAAATGTGDQEELGRHFHIFQMAVLGLITENPDRFASPHDLHRHEETLARTLIDIFTAAFHSITAMDRQDHGRDGVGFAKER